MDRPPMAVFGIALSGFDVGALLPVFLEAQ